MVALEVLTEFAERYKGRPPVTVKLVDWADEEGARFGRSLLGSSAFAGKATMAADRERTHRDGMTLEAALAACGVDVERVGEAAVKQKNLAAYLELHIEQGPILERLGKPLAVVQGTKGVEPGAITFRGQEAHSESTPMEVRRIPKLPIKVMCGLIIFSDCFGRQITAYLNERLNGIARQHKKPMPMLGIGLLCCT